DIICLVNIQHNCSIRGTCSATKTTYEVQEREQTAKLQLRIQHADTTQFLLNIHGFHNAIPIRRALPTELAA
ncbi:hypothetical protein BDV93DRAFT_406722, partial [Ceratobasidium sp. AG-I]